MMYVCLEVSAGLPHNEDLEQINWASGLKVYGDAFVFKKESGSHGADEVGHTRYTDMDKSFVSDAPDGHLAETILRPRELIFCPPKWAMARGAGDCQCVILRDDERST